MTSTEPVKAMEPYFLLFLYGFCIDNEASDTYSLFQYYKQYKR